MMACGHHMSPGTSPWASTPRQIDDQVDLANTDSCRTGVMSTHYAFRNAMSYRRHIAVITPGVPNLVMVDSRLYCFLQVMASVSL
jgi:hypothetical protein